MKVAVIHGFYGCASGCCGHGIVEVGEIDLLPGSFQFDHPDPDAPNAWAQDFFNLYKKKEKRDDLELSLEDCRVSDD